MTENNTRQYPPELKVDFDRTEPSGLRKVKAVPKQMKQGNNWVDNPNGSTKQVAQAVNHVHVVARYADAYKDATTKKFPVYNYGSGPTVSINWRFFIVGPVATETDGTVLTRTTLPVEVGWSDRSTDAWVYDMMTRIINETLAANPGSNIRDHVFEFGKKSGTTPAGAWYFKYAGRLATLYPSIALPADAPREGGAAPRQRQQGPSAAVLNAMPEGANLPVRRETQAEVAQAAPMPPTASVPSFELDGLLGGGPAPSTSPGFAPTAQEMTIAQVMLSRLAEQGTTLREVCTQRNVDPYVVLFNTFTKGQARDPTSDKSISTTPERADFIAKNPSIVGIQL